MHSFIHSFVECFFRIIFTNFRLPKQFFSCFCLEVGLQLSVLNLALLCFVLTHYLIVNQHLAFATTTCFVGGESNSQTLIKDDIFHKKTTTTFGKNSLFSRIISLRPNSSGSHPQLVQKEPSTSQQRNPLTLVDSS